MRRVLPPPLVALSPGDLATKGASRFLDGARAAIGAGLCGILVREPAMGDWELLEVARAVRKLLPDEGWLAIHDRVHLASACGAQAVHLGFRSLSPDEARRILPEGIAVGFSAHAKDEVSSWRSCDYLFFGPVLDTPSKRGIQGPVGFDGLADAVARSPVAVWAIGGLRPEHAARCLACGATGVAVLGGLFGSEDPAGSSKAYLESLSRVLST